MWAKMWAFGQKCGHNFLLVNKGVAMKSMMRNQFGSTCDRVFSGESFDDLGLVCAIN